MDTSEQLFTWLSSYEEPENEDDAKDIAIAIYRRGLAHGEENMTSIAKEWRECYEQAVDSVAELSSEVEALKERLSVFIPQ